MSIMYNFILVSSMTIISYMICIVFYTFYNILVLYIYNRPVDLYDVELIQLNIITILSLSLCILLLGVISFVFCFISYCFETIYKSQHTRELLRSKRHKLVYIFKDDISKNLNVTTHLYNKRDFNVRYYKNFKFHLKLLLRVLHNRFKPINSELVTVDNAFVHITTGINNRMMSFLKSDLMSNSTEIVKDFNDRVSECIICTESNCNIGIQLFTCTDCLCSVCIGCHSRLILSRHPCPICRNQLLYSPICVGTLSSIPNNIYDKIISFSDVVINKIVKSMNTKNKILILYDEYALTVPIKNCISKHKHRYVNESRFNGIIRIDYTSVIFLIKKLNLVEYIPRNTVNVILNLSNRMNIIDRVLQCVDLEKPFEINTFTYYPVLN